jgi:cell division protein FtsB
MSPRRRAGHPLRRKILAWGALLFVATTLARALVGERGLVAVWRHRGEAATIERDIERLRQENERLRGEVRSLRDDPRAVEPIAREDLGYARPGEILILFPRSSPPPAAPR